MAMHLADPIFIFILALVLLGPRKTGELAQQLGKLMADFRRASNDFKYQFNEEMRVADQQERQKQQDAEKALPAASAPTPPAADVLAEPPPMPHPSTVDNTILPPAQETAHTEAVPYAVSATTGQEHPVEDHPLLRVDEIPPMDGAPHSAPVSQEEQHG